MRKIVVWFLLLCLLCPAALGEERINLGGAGYDGLSFRGALPDGRLLFCGTQGVPGNYQNSRARLLCLNRDRTVAWDYTAPDMGNCSFSCATALKNGLIGTVFTDSPNQQTQRMEIRYFTLDGQPAGENIDIFEPHIMISGAAPDCLCVTVLPPEAQVYWRYFLDWEGRILFRMQSNMMMGGGFLLLPGEDCLVLAGYEPAYPANAKIMAIGLNGQKKWETVLPSLLPQGDARLEWAIRAEDGGYVAYLQEQTVDGTKWSKRQRTAAVAKFDAMGRLLWMQQDAFAGIPGVRCSGLGEYQGKIVVGIETGLDFEGDIPRRYLWLDGDGRYLGETHLSLDSDETSYSGQLVPMDGGLWTLRDVRRKKDGKALLEEMDTVDEVLVRLEALELK